MVKSYKTQSLISGVKLSCSDAIRGKKWKIFLIFLFLLAGISAGVVVAVRASSSSGLHNLQEIDLDDYLSGFAASSSAFFARSLSLLVNVVLIFLTSLSPFLFPLSVALLTYRAYLFGLNFALIFVFYGIGSIFTAVVIILPCQIATLIALALVYLLLNRQSTCKKRYGSCEFNRFFFLMLAFLVLILINLIETLLLFLLSGGVIMVI